MEQTDLLAISWPSRSVNCPTCQYAITYHDLKKSDHFACPECATYFEKGEDGSTFIHRIFDKGNHVPFALPMGAKAVYENMEYLLTGAMSKKQSDQEVYWDEYLFYSPQDKGYLIFSEYDGNWLLIRPSANQNLYPDLKDKITYNHRTHTLDLQYHFNIIFATGEFDWNILNDERLEAFEYVSPPYVLINEKNDQEWNWYEAVYTSPKDLLGVIKVPPEKLAIKRGTINFNPETFYPRFKPLMILSGIALAFLILFQLVMSGIHTPKTVFSGSYECKPDSASWESCKPVITPSFHIDNRSPVVISATSGDIDNDWLELQVVMINEDNGKIYETDKTIEYYHGVDGGESWSEGSHSERAILSAVPPGRYHMNIYPFNSKVSGPDARLISFDISVKENEILSSNFWTMLLLITVYPLIQWRRKYLYENSKWFNKGYTTLNDDK